MKVGTAYKRHAKTCTLTAQFDRLNNHLSKYEFWSFVEKKSNQRWTWYAIDKASGIILAWHNGNRTDQDFRQLLKYLQTIPIDYLLHRRLGRIYEKLA
jgi:IS1 family transposase